MHSKSDELGAMICTTGGVRVRMKYSIPERHVQCDRLGRFRRLFLFNQEGANLDVPFESREAE